LTTFLQGKAIAAAGRKHKIAKPTQIVPFRKAGVTPKPSVENADTVMTRIKQRAGEDRTGEDQVEPPARPCNIVFLKE